MNKKLLIILLTAGIAVGGCNSSSKQENMEDSSVIDTVVRTDSVVVDTTPVADTTGKDTL